jgi:quercetin dioxygenase-like cupin family protein
MSMRDFESVQRVTAQLRQATLHNSVWYRGQLITFLAIGEETGGRFALLRVHAVQGIGEPSHYHPAADESLYVLEGELTVVACADEHHAGPNDTVTIPRGVEHAIRHETATVCYLLQFSPAGFERYFHEMSEAAQYLGPPSHPAPSDADHMMAAATRYGCVFTATF